MMRILIGFLSVWLLVTAGIHVWQGMAEGERWETRKLITFGFVTALLSCMFIAVFVILF